MEGPIKKVVIVGGGTAGWLTALFISRALNREVQDRVSVVLVESSDIAPVGVGEATVPTLRRTFQGLGLDEKEWMAACNASFKLAINFAGWSNGPAPGSYWHPFAEQIPMVEGLPVWHAWLKHWLQGSAGTFAESCFGLPALCTRKKAPKTINAADYQSEVPYAYHLDAGLLASYLKRKACAANVKHVVDNVTDVRLDNRGYIQEIVTEKAGNLSADLFIDCTGFRGLLIGKALNEPFLPYSDYLFCDRALALSVPTDSNAPLDPFTTATALNAGWVWDIPLFSRRGVGYVYASGCISDEEAERELLAFLGEVKIEGDIKRIKMRVGRSRNLWVKNCVAVGLAGGFIEPLESTGIFLIEVGLKHLWECFPDKNFDHPLRDRYNQIMRRYYEDVRDFIVLHYCLTQRQDTEFWKANHFHPAVPDTLREKLERWKGFLPNPEEIPEPRLFTAYSYVSILAGMECLPDRAPAILDYTNTSSIEQQLWAIEDRSRVLRNQLPDHRAYLQHLRSEEEVTRMGP
jgi:tryptophan halogenase